MNNKRYKKRPKTIVDDNFIPPFDAGEMSAPIETLSLNEATFTLLKGANYNNILDLVKKTEKDFYKITKFNKKNLLELIYKLKSKGFYLKPLPEINITTDENADSQNKLEGVSSVTTGKMVTQNSDMAKISSFKDKNVSKTDNTANSNFKKEKSDNQNNKVKPNEKSENVNNKIKSNERFENFNNKARPNERSENLNNKAKPNERSENLNNKARPNERSESPYNKAKPSERRDDKRTDNRPKPLEMLKLSELTLKLMKSAGYKYIDDVISKNESDIMKIKNFKKKDLFHLLEKLDALNLTLSGQEIEVKRKRPVRDIVKEEPDLYVKINKNGKWGFQDRSGKLVVPAIYDEVYTYKDDMCCVEKDEKYGFINRKGEEVVPIEYDCACSFSEGYAFVFKKDKGGYVDKENNNLTEFIFDAGTIVLDGNSRVKKDGKWGELFVNNPSEIRWII